MTQPSFVDAREPLPLSKVWARLTVVVTSSIALFAFWMSFEALSDLAHMSGMNPQIAWMWPAATDGMIVAATVATVALAGHVPSARRYAWALLVFGAAISVAGNAIHALVSQLDEMPTVVAVTVASLPPIELVLATHLTVVVLRRARPPVAAVSRGGSPAPDVAELYGHTAMDVREFVDGDELVPGEISRLIDVPAQPRATVPAATHRESVPEHQQDQPEQPGAPRSIDHLSDDGEAAFRDWVAMQTEAGVKVTGAMAGEYLAVAESTGRRRLQRVRAELEAAETTNVTQLRKAVN